MFQNKNTNITRKIGFFHTYILSCIKLTCDNYKCVARADPPLQTGPSDNGLNYFKIPIDVKHKKTLRKNKHSCTFIPTHTHHPHKQSRDQQSQSSFGKTNLKPEFVFCASTSHQQVLCISLLNIEDRKCKSFPCNYL